MAHFTNGADHPCQLNREPLRPLVVSTSTPVRSRFALFVQKMRQTLSTVITVSVPTMVAVSGVCPIAIVAKKRIRTAPLLTEGSLEETRDGEVRSTTFLR